MLQKYEAEVRNHIKIEQQLKLHIECVQDKLDDSEKAKDKYKKERKSLEEESSKELGRYKDLLSLREKELDALKNEVRRLQKVNEDLKSHMEKVSLNLERNKYQQKETPNKGSNNGPIMKTSSGGLGTFEDLTYQQAFDNSIDGGRGQKLFQPTSANNGQISNSSGVSGTGVLFKTQGGNHPHHHGTSVTEPFNNNASVSSERSMELMRLKKEYNQMVKKEISKVKKEKEQ